MWGVDRAVRDGNQGRFGRPNGDSENWTGVVPWGHARMPTGVRPSQGPGGRPAGTRPDGVRPVLVRPRHFSAR